MAPRSGCLGLLIERIFSSGQASPPGFCYGQPQAEWVLLLQGEALLRFADEDEARRLQAGDWLDIAAHRRHRVEWTAPDRLTIWLAVFCGEQGRQPAEAGRQRCEAPFDGPAKSAPSGSRGTESPGCE